MFTNKEVSTDKKKKNRKRKLLVKFQCPITELKNQIEVILPIEVQDKSPERGI